MQSGIVGNFVFEELDRNRGVFKGLLFEDFVLKINGTDLYFKHFQKKLYKSGLDIKLMNSSKSVVKRYILAEFARQLFGENVYYEIVLKEDAMIKAVLK